MNLQELVAAGSLLTSPTFSGVPISSSDLFSIPSFPLSGILTRGGVYCLHEGPGGYSSHQLHFRDIYSNRRHPRIPPREFPESSGPVVQDPARPPASPSCISEAPLEVFGVLSLHRIFLWYLSSLEPSFCIVQWQRPPACKL